MEQRRQVSVSASLVQSSMSLLPLSLSAGWWAVSSKFKFLGQRPRVVSLDRYAVVGVRWSAVPVPEVARGLTLRQVRARCPRRSFLLLVFSSLRITLGPAAGRTTMAAAASGDDLVGAVSSEWQDQQHDESSQSSSEGTPAAAAANSSGSSALQHLLQLPLRRLDLGVCVAIANVYPQLTELNLDSNGQTEGVGEGGSEVGAGLKATTAMLTSLPCLSLVLSICPTSELTSDSILPSLRDHLPSLRVIDFSFNRLTSVPPMDALEHLEEINLRGNRMSGETRQAKESGSAWMPCNLDLVSHTTPPLSSFWSLPLPLPARTSATCPSTLV